jgi:hypothetical protein
MKTALWNENLLSASVGRLEKRVDNLERTSCMHFHKVHPNSSSHYTQPSQEEIGSIIRQKRRMQHLFLDLHDAYDGLQIHRSGLSFTPFDDAEICQLGTQHELTVTLLIVCSKPSSVYGHADRSSPHRLSNRTFKVKIQSHNIVAWLPNVIWMASMPHTSAIEPDSYLSRALPHKNSQ